MKRTWRKKQNQRMAAMLAAAFLLTQADGSLVCGISALAAPAGQQTQAEQQTKDGEENPAPI